MKGLDTTNLEKFLKALKNRPRARVGILGDKAGRSESVANNATIGAYHEFGTTKMPQRSFLRMPISEKLNEKLKNSGAFDKDVLAEVVSRGTIVPWLKLVAITAESIVLEAFGSGGFGKWPQWSEKYKSKTGSLLVDTTQLRESITHDVKERSA